MSDGLPGETIEDSDVLVLGGGFAGTWCVRRLRRRLGAGTSITLVSELLRERAAEALAVDPMSR